MIACLDVDYRDGYAVAAGLEFFDWDDEQPATEFLVRIEEVEPYEPGRFYLRELPCLLEALKEVDDEPDAIVIDGYVWLGEEGDPGLGAHLHRAIGGRSAVVGVAKTRFLRARAVEEVLRGESLSPLFVSATGMDLVEAARLVRGMHGPHRIPTLLKRVDRLCRTGLPRA